MHGRTERLTALIVLVTAVLWCLSSQFLAVADSSHPVIETLPEKEVRAAVAAARTPTAVNLARSNLGIPAQETASLRVADRGTVVHHLNPAFGDGNGHLPLAVPGYVAVTATSVDGRKVTLQVARVAPADGGPPRWAPVAAAQDDTEADLARTLETDEVLYENQGPRGREWYALDDRSLRPLTAGHGEPEVSGAVSITSYTKALRERAATAGPSAPPVAVAGRGHEQDGRPRFLLGVAAVIAAGSFAILRYRRGRPDRHRG